MVNIRMVTKPTKPGLQPERTSMAWLRTSLALVLISLLVLRFGLFYSQFAALLAALASVICCFYIYINIIRGRKKRKSPNLKYHIPRHEAMAISILAVLVSIAVLI